MKHYLSLAQDEEIKKLESLIYVEELLVIKIVYEKKDGNIIAKQQSSEN